VLSQIISLIADIGLGAVAIGLTRALKANVDAHTALLSKLETLIDNHELRLNKLEGK
jgi:hypothetical protein